MLLIILIQAIAAYFAADFFSGIYHVLTDKGWNTKEQVESFRLHHLYPGNMGFDIKPMVAAVPLAMFAWWISSPFLLFFAIFGGLSQLTHYYAHIPYEFRPKIVRELQYGGIILDAIEHSAHHNGVYDSHYCVLSGWCNPLVDKLAPLVPWRE